MARRITKTQTEQPADVWNLFTAAASEPERPRSAPQGTPTQRHNRERRGKRSIQERFEEFHEKHPEVWKHYVEMSFEWYNAARRRGEKPHGSIAMFTETIRYQRYVTQDDGEEFKISDNYRSRYARKLMDTYQELRECAFFDTKPLRAE